MLDVQTQFSAFIEELASLDAEQKAACQEYDEQIRQCRERLNLLEGQRLNVAVPTASRISLLRSNFLAVLRNAVQNEHAPKTLENGVGKVTYVRGTRKWDLDAMDKLAVNKPEVWSQIEHLRSVGEDGLRVILKVPSVSV